MAQILKCLNKKDAAEFMLAVTAGKPLDMTNWKIPKHLQAYVIAANLPEMERQINFGG